MEWNIAGQLTSRPVTGTLQPRLCSCGADADSPAVDDCLGLYMV